MSSIGNRARRLRRRKTPKSKALAARYYRKMVRAISALIRCTTLVPVPHSRAVLRTPLPLASAARMAAFFCRIDPRPADRPAALGPLRSRLGKLGVDSLVNDCALELCKDPKHLEERPSAGVVVSTACLSR